MHYIIISVILSCMALYIKHAMLMVNGDTLANVAEISVRDIIPTSVFV